MNLCLVLPVRNRKHLTQAILAQLTDQLTDQTTSQTQTNVNSLQVYLIVVDDGSTDGTQALIQTQFPQVHLLLGDGTLWWTGAIVKGMDYGLRQFAPDYLLLLNDDITLPDDFIKRLEGICLDLHQGYWQGTSDRFNLGQDTIVGGIILARGYPGLIAYGGVIAGQPLRHWHDFGEVTTVRVDTLNGNLVLIPRKVVETIGLPDAKRFPHYGGDYEYFCRAKKAGVCLFLARDLTAIVDFTAQDVIRYLPAWMQWYLAPGLAQKLKVLQGLTSLKSNYNIWHMVNSMNRDKPQPPLWDYWLFYLRKLGQVVWYNLNSPKQIEAKIKDYLQKQRFPWELIQEVLSLNRIR
jgi:glycosyltransferase involved in cell wall biosynthesis